jgi:hypothetical protein
VLLKLAQLDLLRKVEVISTVSGGSIIGAQLYLHLRRLLEEKPDKDITRDRYVKLVLDMDEELRDAASKNVRTRAFKNFWPIVKMISPNYSRSERVGELYDKWLYRPLVENADGPLKLRDLEIRPADGVVNNADRSAKVPALLVNATALNSGHNWRFMPDTMGEPPLKDPDELDLDKGTRLERPKHYSEFKNARLRDFELGEAVAASACVPGLFFPVPIRYAYSNVAVQLVDGGVHDNQGVQGLVDEDGVSCNRLIVSDGSGQMDWKAFPAPDLRHALGRSNQILMQRVREQQLLYAKRKSPTNVLVHLRSDLRVWTLHPRKLSGEAPPEESGATYLPIPVHPDVQGHLAGMRTDLDSFTKVEATSLAVLGYALGTANPVLDPTATNEIPEQWKQAEAAVANPGDRYLRQLKAARSRWLRPLLMLRKASRFALLMALGLAVAAALVFVDDLRDWLGNAAVDVWRWSPDWRLARGFLIALAVALVLFMGAAAERSRRPFRLVWVFTTFVVGLLRTILLIPVWLLANAYVWTVDRWVIRRGGQFG